MAAAGTVPDLPGDEFSEDELDEPQDPWAGAARATRPPSDRPPGYSAEQSPTTAAAADREEYRQFLEHLRRSRRSRPSRTQRSDRSDDDAAGGSGGGDRSNAGPPPTWDGTTAFKDYAIRVRLWLATTKVLRRAVGALSF